MKLCYTVLIPCAVDAECTYCGFICALDLFSDMVNYCVSYVDSKVKITSLALFQAFTAKQSCFEHRCCFCAKTVIICIAYFKIPCCTTDMHT